MSQALVACVFIILNNASYILFSSEQHMFWELVLYKDIL